MPYPDAVLLTHPEQVDEYVQKIRHAINNPNELHDILVDLHIDAEYTIGNRDPVRNWDWPDLDNVNVPELTEETQALAKEASRSQDNADQTDSDVPQQDQSWASTTHQLIEALEEAITKVRKDTADAEDSPI